MTLYDLADRTTTLQSAYTHGPHCGPPEPILAASSKETCVMGDLVEHLSDLIGISAESAGLVIAALAILLIVVGCALLIVTVFGKWASTLEADTSSRLLPTLVEDVLDSDLQHIYRQSLLVDSRVADSFDNLAEPTGTELGRSARQYVVRLQAQRFAARQAGSPSIKTGSPSNKAGSASNKTGEPLGEGARLDEVAAMLEAALERLPLDQSGSAPEAEAERILEEFCARLGSHRLKNTPT
jgi:hypothetical protein